MANPNPIVPPNKATGLTLQQKLILSFIRENPGCARKDVDIPGMASRTIYGVIQRLEQRGMVEDQSANDRPGFGIPARLYVLGD